MDPFTALGLTVGIEVFLSFLSTISKDIQLMRQVVDLRTAFELETILHQDYAYFLLSGTSFTYKGISNNASFRAVMDTRYGPSKAKLLQSLLRNSNDNFTLTICPSSRVSRL